MRQGRDRRCNGARHAMCFCLYCPLGQQSPCTDGPQMIAFQAKRSTRKQADCDCLVAEPKAAARAAGLRYVDDAQPGISRRRRGRWFEYVAPSGKVVKDPRVLQRIRSLVIPPAWTDVWICTKENGHLQATGRDSRSRKQYRYHPRWRAVRDEGKYGKMLIFGKVLPAIRAQVERDLSRHGLPREKVLAAIVRLLEGTLIRVGNEEYAKTNNSFGLTTLRNRHVKIDGGSRIRFDFRGKSGTEHHINLHDRKLAAIV